MSSNGDFNTKSAMSLWDIYSDFLKREELDLSKGFCSIKEYIKDIFNIDVGSTFKFGPVYAGESYLSPEGSICVKELDDLGPYGPRIILNIPKVPEEMLNISRKEREERKLNRVLKNRSILVRVLARFLRYLLK